MSKLLTPLELKVMNILWKLKKGFVKDILERWPEDPEPDAKKPAYNTVSTTVRILEDKGYIDHKAFGRTYEYFPSISKAEYQKRLLGNVIENAFGGSVKSLMSALVDADKVSDKDLTDIQDLIDKSNVD